MTNPLPTRRKFANPNDSIYYSRLARWYRRRLQTHPFTSFGLPFVFLIVSGSFFLTPATAVRYERHDRKTHMLDREEELGLAERRKESRRKGKWADRDVREEYWRLAGQGEKLDDWEPKRVKRLPGEPDGTFD
ncbi:MAG: Cytochrome oxidase assembly [Chrysothrix sp. TS-e1954]|nr:MAG: Cytochrome oxidase assembly [Chrysothrix sp. TS-e1954]